MKKTKLWAALGGVVLIVLLAVIGLRVAGIGPFASETARRLHTSQNGIQTMDNGYMRKDLTSLELVNLMGNGINLGNTMEAYGHKELGVNAEVSAYETFWGQPVTTQEMLHTMKEAGFDSLRIPIAWTNTMDYENGDYTISEAYLNRVEEIINYAINEEMYVVINDHWDGSWWGMFGSASADTRQKAMDLYVSMWTQIANRYKEYSDYLIFESGNEELGNRLNDVDVAADSGALSKDDCYMMVNVINQTFVDTIRGTGGNNKERFLLIAGYNTDIDATCDSRFVMPTDTAESKLMVSVHYYNPFGYCGSGSLANWGTQKQYEEQNELLAMMTKFTDAGYGVIFGEYAVALNTDGTVKENTCSFINNFLDNCDLYGYCPMLWDCSSLFIRSELAFLDADVEKLFNERSYTAQSAMTEDEVKAAARTALDTALANAPEKLEEDAPDAVDENTALAWIMFNSNDWNLIYSVGDVYDPASKTEGIAATDVEITGAGTYTVGLDFTKTAAGYANSTAFCALGITNGELLYPGYIITITDIQINGESYPMTASNYTASDDRICTRSNIYNAWVSAVPEEARGVESDASPSIVDNTELGNIETLTITFEYAPEN